MLRVSVIAVCLIRGMGKGMGSVHGRSQVGLGSSLFGMLGVSGLQLHYTELMLHQHNNEQQKHNKTITEWKRGRRLSRWGAYIRLLEPSQ